MSYTVNCTHYSGLSTVKREALGSTYIVTSVLSIVGSASIVFAVIFKKKVCNAEVRPIFHLSLADLVASLSLLLGSIPYRSHTGFDLTTRKWCSYITATSSCFYMNTFIFTALYGYEVYSKLRDKLKGIYPRETFTNVYCFYSFAWIAPVAVTLCIFAIDSGESGKGSLNDDICGTCLPVFHYRTTNCSLAADSRHEPNWNFMFRVIFLVALGVSILAVMIVYIMVLSAFRKIQIAGGIMSRQQYKQETSVRRSACLYQVVFLVCWLPSIILGLCSLFHNHLMIEFFALYEIQALITPLQGFFNCIIYGWRRRGFHKVLKQKNYRSIDSSSNEHTQTL